MAKKQSSEDLMKSNVAPETILSSFLEALEAKRKVEEVQGVYRAVLKRAKSLGVKPALIVEMISAKRADPEEIRLQLRERIRYLALINIPTQQDDLFGDLDMSPASARAQEQLAEAGVRDHGYMAGKSGTPIEDCPHQAGASSFVLWRAAWVDGQAALAASFVEGSRPASTRKAKNRKSDDADEAAAPAEPKRRGRPPKARAAVADVGEEPSVH
jgi:hypothetical protein